MQSIHRRFSSVAIVVCIWAVITAMCPPCLAETGGPAKKVAIVFGERKNGEAFGQLLQRAGLICQLQSEATLGRDWKPKADLVVFLCCCKGGGCCGRTCDSPWDSRLLDRMGYARVLACGGAGAALLDTKELLIGYSHGWHDTDCPKKVIFPEKLVKSPLGQVLLRPNKLIDSPHGAASIVIHAGEGTLAHTGIYDGGCFPEGTVGIGREAADNHHWIICKQGNYVLWGADSRADNLTQDGKALFANLCWRLAHAEPEPLVFPAKEYLDPGTHKGNLKGGYDDEYYFRVKDEGQLEIVLEWDGDITMMLMTHEAFVKRVDGRSPLRIARRIGKQLLGKEIKIDVHSFDLREGVECPYRLHINTIKGVGGLHEKSVSSTHEWAGYCKGSVHVEAEIGRPFPNISFTTCCGNHISIQDFRGKVLLLDFWSTRCGPCRNEMPNLVSVYRKYHGDGFEIVGISLDTDKDRLVQYLRENDIGWPQYFDGGGWHNEIAKLFGVCAIPRTYLIDREGVLRKKMSGGDDLSKAIRRLVQPGQEDAE